VQPLTSGMGSLLRRSCHSVHWHHALLSCTLFGQLDQADNFSCFFGLNGEFFDSSDSTIDIFVVLGIAASERRMLFAREIGVAIREGAPGLFGFDAPVWLCGRGSLFQGFFLGVEAKLQVAALRAIERESGARLAN